MGTLMDELSRSRLQKILETPVPVDIRYPRFNLLSGVIAAEAISTGERVTVGTDGLVHPVRTGEPVLGTVVGTAGSGGEVEILLGPDFSGITMSQDTEEISYFGSNASKEVPTGPPRTVVEFKDGTTAEIYRKGNDEWVGRLRNGGLERNITDVGKEVRYSR